ncbi:hypothetical protein BGM26_10350 [Bacillus sp. FJAT-29790]|uniref:hypothetical protein n=1 Tax=Bacillus sp. FJAT-29790 TaxID=1895002 RepID=UPI001C23F307|nr:hypothetical protein [Bacillus sp. FJAT-29790]MBU8879384.1 hypothetical protein [Bacillus sp. FJAT-29790]
MGRLLSIFMIGLGGYLVFQNRYRVMNVLFGNSFIRRILVNSFMSLPGIRDRMMKSVFPSSPADFR